MPEAAPIAVAQRVAPPPVPHRAAQPEPKRPAVEQGGIYTRFQELADGPGAAPPPADRVAPLIARPEYAHPANNLQQARVVSAMQARYGNHYVQTVMASRSPDGGAGGRGATAAPGAAPLGLVQRAPAAGNTPTAAPQSVLTAPGMGGGQPLDTSTRLEMERQFGHDFSDVRTHTGPEAHAAAAGMGAVAFTTGRDIYFSQGTYNPASPAGRGLLAHELAHVVQQGHGSAPAAAQGYAVSQPGDLHEREAAAASVAVTSGRPVPVLTPAGAGAGLVQRNGDEEQHDEGWVMSTIWSTLEWAAPELVPILRQGVLEWLKEQIGNLINNLMNSLAAPIRSVGDLVTTLRTHFRNLVNWLREAGQKIANNDCSSFADAADKIHQAFDSLTGPVIERLQHYATAAKEFFQSLWDRFGAPVWDFLRMVGGAIWDRIQAIGRWIWEKTAPLRSLISYVWTRFKNWLGIGEGEEGQNGILQWFQRKASDAWSWISERIAPYKRQILIAVGILALLSPVGPLILVVGAAAGILRGVQWIRQNMRNRESVVQQRVTLRGVILPAIMNTITNVATMVRNFANSITNTLMRAANFFDEMVATVGSISLLSFATGLLQTVGDGFHGLLDWANEGVHGLAEWVQSGLDRLGGLATRLVNFLERVGAVVQDAMKIAGNFLSEVWNIVPACIRDPFIDFFVPLILRQISFFRALASDPQAWQQTRQQITTLIRQVFQDFDLIGAMKTAFGIVARALRLPLELLDQVIDKASQAFDAVLNDPLKFIENSLKAILRGLGKFMGNILSHLMYGVTNWLFASARDRGIEPPSSIFDLGAVFTFVLDVLGISINHVFELLERRIDPAIVRRMRQALNILTGVWEFVAVAINEGPAGLWRMVVERLSDLGTTILNAAVEWVMTRIIAIISARLTAIAASAGLSGIVEAVVAVYQAIQTAIQYATRILQVMLKVFDTVLQIAQGVIEPAAAMVEQGLRMIMPVIIAFLANWAGLGGISERIGEIIDSVRERVENAILALIDRALAIGQSIINMFRRPQTAEEDSPEKAALKEEALAAVRTRTQGRTFQTFNEFGDVLSGVFGEFQPRGLRGLEAKVDTASLALTVSASASVPNTTRIIWADIFTATPLDDAALTELFQQFTGGGSDTYAAVSVNGRLIGSARQGSEHAEQEVVNSSDWEQALAAADQAASQGNAAEVVLLINRSPCGDVCTPFLTSWLRLNRKLHPRVKFVLAATGNYAPLINIEDLREQTQEYLDATGRGDHIPVNQLTRQQLVEILGPFAVTGVAPNRSTTSAHLAQLAGVGWELRQLAVGRQGPKENVLAGRIEGVRSRMHAAAKRDVEAVSKKGST
jgi:phage-related protein